MSSSHAIEKPSPNAANLGSRRNSPESEKPHDSHERDHEHGLAWTELVRIGFVALAAAIVWFRIWEPSRE